MIKFENLTRYYGDVCAVDHVSFEVKKGEILGFLGPNGAGKTTTYRILTGYLQATDGTIKVKDYDIHDDQLEIKKLIGYLPESAPIYHDMLVYDYLDYIADIRGVAEAGKLPHIKELADLCSLNEVMHKTVNQLSKGYRQRVGIAHALMGNPEILVLDEPTVGLDPNQIVDTREIIKRIGKEKTIIFSTHILSEAKATCDRFVIINKGKLAADLTIDQLNDLTKDQSFEELFRNLTRGDNQ
ncbi:MAG: ATP-binding cassette domain-containing protein [Candidatus Aminicenantes bacterium]|nr:ATP-binding cassette domain-containing protein [Candidatus Aminicenantes bacterium]